MDIFLQYIYQHESQSKSLNYEQVHNIHTDMAYHYMYRYNCTWNLHDIVLLDDIHEYFTFYFQTGCSGAYVVINVSAVLLRMTLCNNGSTGNAELPAGAQGAVC